MDATMQWRVCHGFPAFEVSEYGDLRNRETRKRVKGYITSDGYVAYRISDTNGDRFEMMAHALILEAFVEPRPSDRHQVAHNNGSRLMNHYSNLRWATSLENQRDRFVHGTSSAGTANGRATITDDDVLFIREEYRRIKASGGRRSVSELDERFGLCRSTIINIATGKSWRHIPMPDWHGFKIDRVTSNESALKDLL